MTSHRLLPLLCLFTLALSALGCEEDPAASLAEGESHVSLELSGGSLAAPLRFNGTTEAINDFVSDDITLLAGTPIGVASAPAGYELGLMTLEVRRITPGTVDADGFDINLVVHGFNNASGSTAYSLRERVGASSMTITAINDDRITLHFEFDASPTQMNSTDLVFHVEGELETRR